MCQTLFHAVVSKNVSLTELLSSAHKSTHDMLSGSNSLYKSEAREGVYRENDRFGRRTILNGLPSLNPLR